MPLLRQCALLVAYLVLAATALANQVPQQSGTSCSAAWDVGRALAAPGSTPRRPWLLACEDGDASCDVDGRVDGACVLAIRVCVLPSLEGCVPPEQVRHLRLPRHDKRLLPGLGSPELPATAPACGAPGLLHLSLTTGTATKSGPLPCPDGAGPQTQDDACGSGSCDAVCTGAACVGRDVNGDCVDAKGGVSQLCCSSDTSTPCFPTRGGGTISRTGSPGVNGQTLTFAATFCIARPPSSLLGNAATGLPGPGALLLPAQVQVLP